MKKLLILTAAVALLAASCNQSTTSTTTSTTTTTTTPPPTTQTYSNATYNFQFQYPVALQFVTPNYADLQDKVVEVQIPKTDYPGTNFGDAAVAVSADYAKTLAACLALNPPEGSDGFKTPASINGVTFYMTNSNGAGAGNFYNAKVYRTLTTNGTCLEIIEMIHTADIGNFTPGTVTAVDSNAVQTRLDAILNTFKFTS